MEHCDKQTTSGTSLKSSPWESQGLPCLKIKGPREKSESQNLCDPSESQLKQIKLFCDSLKTGIVHVVRQTGFFQDTMVKWSSSSLIYSELHVKHWLVKPVHPRGPHHLSVVHLFQVSQPICASGMRICTSGKTLYLLSLATYFKLGDSTILFLPTSACVSTSVKSFHLVI